METQGPRLSDAWENFSSNATVLLQQLDPKLDKRVVGGIVLTRTNDNPQQQMPTHLPPHQEEEAPKDSHSPKELIRKLKWLSKQSLEASSNDLKTMVQFSDERKKEEASVKAARPAPSPSSPSLFPSQGLHLPPNLETRKGLRKGSDDESQDEAHVSPAMPQYPPGPSFHHPPNSPSPSSPTTSSPPQKLQARTKFRPSVSWKCPTGAVYRKAERINELYSVTAEVGAGGFARVYSAKNRDTDTEDRKSVV